ncbi:porphobilinogen synthase [Nanchangia anserum]|uniref:Delta-aminolevulinic acid dehydratase n=2 Tax=Nanchangia anserum TaxID=2692125 RepID=A0A8I0KRP3_9ACTO|nr:porphobilinogen synthase [Nanchangia anserum]MBD3689602.1 porphobilinogen synthase [Nanchangia anserum]QOX82665.1 porphobilinogen synthase [Nanchangia anserum]
MRDLVAETHVHPRQLILPVFVADGLSEPRPIASLPGIVQHSLDSLVREAERVVTAGLGGIMVFGVPRKEDKDPRGSAAWADDGILNRALAAIRDAVGDDTVIMADTCLDEFTSHGHCGVLDPCGNVDNDETLPLYARMALSQARSGAHVVAPSGMMDGQVALIRDTLDRHGFTSTAIMAYSAKYASGFFGPFRDAVGCSLRGDRRTYQQDPRNSREGLREAELDIAEGADFVMVKPAGYYLDVLTRVAEISPVPVCAYQVSGEYAMIEAAAANGWLERERVIDESITSIVRAGADQVLTYWALEAAQRIGV